ncbi:SRPBCC domain-containing protein [Saccharicrinis sp. FJH54]|uniref:SRPBCC family protein n=1 Tax=Saccharicrinis sp. FJH54 TaxID=3344665 RepID=UPI0035D49E76
MADTKHATGFPLIKEFIYNAATKKVWQALTDKSMLQKWYFPQIQSFEPKVGFTFTFDDDHDRYRKIWIVTQITTGKTFAHSWSYNGYPGKSEVIFDLFPENNKTRLRVTHTGLESFPDDPHFNRERFEWGWNSLLGQNLKHLLEKE